ncbi:tubulin-like doman-containing protein [Zavarzinella formosa]|uniref:tubulin-like doman-containing protein n=1 Tax=Zavarzinella formosa TaxID=360055 RepID=UPI0002EBE838|nr:tubulin-like doman-containing protein [Zavarzinella formosa]
MSLRVEPNVEAIPGYRLIERIGGGGFGEVWKAEAPGGLFKAIKIIHGDLRSVDKNGSRHAEQELRALKRLQAIRHPYLLSIERYDIIDGRLLIVTELADCNLWDRFRECRSQDLPGIPRAELQRYLEEASEVLDLMNNQYQLQHLDIKPQNLFLVYNHVKVADFGLVKDLEGMQGVITGGVTPVYAAPETFENKLTRYCDQYSLAIVYQELLTGIRPFNGTSGQQLLMQHIREAPNLASLPPADREAVGRALSKKPEDRFPSCHDFMRALASSGGSSYSVTVSGPSFTGSRVDTPSNIRHTPSSSDGSPSSDGSQVRAIVQTPIAQNPKTELHLRRPEALVSPSAYTVHDAPVTHKTAPPEHTGDGLLVPAIVIGLGETGLHILREFRRSSEELIGHMDHAPHVRTIFLDTASETLHTATQDGPGALPSADVIPARLNRAAHYMKPRRNGRSLVEGWFDPQTLYKIPRTPETLGIRSLGRLAFMDHYRLFGERIASDIQSITHTDTLANAERHTKLGLRSNRPLIYVVCNLAGGTGGGMFLDAAYAARHKLRQEGYLEPEVIGVFIIPSADRQAKGPAMANTYAALREMHHYSQEDTVFTAHYDEREGRVSDPAPPFARCVILPTPVVSKGSAGGEQLFEALVRRAGSIIARDLFTPLGRTADDNRWHHTAHGKDQLNLSVIGQSSFIWPKQMLLARASRYLSASVLARWIESDPQMIGQYVENWLNQRWIVEGLAPEIIVGNVQQISEQVFGQPAEAFFAAEAQPFAKKGWFNREPDLTRMNQTLAKLLQLVGMPDEHSMQRSVGSLELLLQETADRQAAEYVPKIMRLATTLLEHPDYRFVGAEQVIRQIKARLEGLLQQYEPHATHLNHQAIEAYYRIVSFVSTTKGPRRPNLTEAVEAMRNYPTWRFHSLVLRQVCRIFNLAKTQLDDQLREFEFCRQRLADIMRGMLRERHDHVPPPERMLLPPGVASPEAALESLQKSITPEDVRVFDKRLQIRIEKEFTTLLNVCQSSATLLASLQSTIEDQAREFFAPRLGAANIAQMFFARFPDMKTATQAMGWLFEQATPPLVLPPSERREMVLVAGPAGQSAHQFQQLAKQAIPSSPCDYVTSQDEILVYREYSQVPLNALPQTGPVGEDAYNAALDGVTPHSRFDVKSWQDVETV